MTARTGGDAWLGARNRKGGRRRIRSRIPRARSRPRDRELTKRINRAKHVARSGDSRPTRFRPRVVATLAAPGAHARRFAFHSTRTQHVSRAAISTGLGDSSGTSRSRRMRSRTDFAARYPGTILNPANGNGSKWTELNSFCSC